MSKYVLVTIFVEDFFEQTCFGFDEISQLLRFCERHDIKIKKNVLFKDDERCLYQLMFKNPSKDVDSTTTLSTTVCINTEEPEEEIERGIIELLRREFKFSKQ